MYLFRLKAVQRSTRCSQRPAATAHKSSPYSAADFPVPPSKALGPPPATASISCSEVSFPPCMQEWGTLGRSETAWMLTKMCINSRSVGENTEGYTLGTAPTL